jgi:hypothetical protein
VRLLGILSQMTVMIQLFFRKKKNCFYTKIGYSYFSKKRKLILHKNRYTCQLYEMPHVTIISSTLIDFPIIYRGVQDPMKPIWPARLAPWNTGFTGFTAGTDPKTRDPHGAGCGSRFLKKPGTRLTSCKERSKKIKPYPL